MRLQSNLGNVEYLFRGDLDNKGKIALATVKGTNNKNQTVDVVLFNDFYLGEADDERTISCKRMESSTGFEREAGLSHGSVTPLQDGELVLVAFVDSMKYRPVIIGSIAPPSNEATYSPKVKAKGEEADERFESFTVSKNQDHTFTNGDGEFEKNYHTGTVITGRKEKVSDHRENGYSYNDITLRKKKNYEPIRAAKDKVNYKPFNYLMVTKNIWEDEEDTIYTRFYHDSEHGVTRVSRDGKNKLTYFEMDDGVTLQMQRDSNRRPRKEYEPSKYEHNTLRKSDRPYIEEVEKKEPEFQKINDFTSLKMNKDGSVEVFMQNGPDASVISLSQNGISLKSSLPISIDSQNNISVNSNTNISMTAPSIAINDNVYPGVDNPHREDKENEWQQQWINKLKKNGANLQG